MEGVHQALDRSEPSGVRGILIIAIDQVHPTTESGFTFHEPNQEGQVTRRRRKRGGVDHAQGTADAVGSGRDDGSFGDGVASAHLHDRTAGATKARRGKR